MSIPVVVLYSSGCAATPGTVELVRDVAAEMGLEIELEVARVESQEQAERLRFRGSPTVLVNGLDIESAVRHIHRFGFM